MALMTQKEYADSRGFSKQYVGKLVAQGVIALNSDKLLDPQAADVAREAKSDPARRMGDDSAPAAGQSYQDARTEQVQLTVKRDQLAFAREAGLVVEVAAVELEHRTAGRKVRDRLLRIPHDIRGEVAACSDEKECGAILTRAISKALAELADAIAAEPAQPDTE